MISFYHYIEFETLELDKMLGFSNFVKQGLRKRWEGETSIFEMTVDLKRYFYYFLYTFEFL